MKLKNSLLVVVLFYSSILFARDVPILKIMEIYIPVKEYSIIDFPFKIEKLQFKAFNKKVKKIKNGLVVKDKENKETPEKVNLNKINFNKKLQTKNGKKPKAKQSNILGLEKGINVLTFRPKYKGDFEMIVWGNKEFPMILKINVVEPEKADKYIHFVQVIKNKKVTKKFEAMPHEKVIEHIMRYLYSKQNRKPAGYRDIVRKEVHVVNILNHYSEIIGKMVVSLQWETLGREYKGEVWNVDVYDNIEYKKIEKLVKKDTSITFSSQKKLVRNNHNSFKYMKIKEIYSHTLPDGFSLRLYNQLFDAEGVYGISVERYWAAPKNGTRVMIVRSAK